MVTGHGMRWIVRGAVVALVVGACNGEHGESGHEGDRCLRSENCLGSLECVENVCVAPTEGDASGTVGDSTVPGVNYYGPGPGCAFDDIDATAQVGDAGHGIWSSWSLMYFGCCNELCGESGGTCVPNGCDDATVRGPTGQYNTARLPFLGSPTCSPEEELPTWSGNVCAQPKLGLFQCCCSGPAGSGLECPPPPVYCTPGDQRPCACADGSTGTEVCRADGLYGRCEASCPCDPGGPCDCGGGPGTATCGPDGSCLCGSWVDTYTQSSICSDICVSEGTTCVPLGCDGFTLKMQHPYTGRTPYVASCDSRNYFTFPVVACCCSASATPDAGLDASGVPDAGDAG